MRKFVLNKKLLLVLWMLVPNFTTVAHANYNNPTRASDCNVHSAQYPFTSRKDRIWQRVNQCNASYSSTEIIREDVQGLNVQTSCWGVALSRCAPLYEQHCQMESQMRGIRQMCMAKLEARQARERERKIIEEQAAREREQFLKDSAAVAVTPGAIDKSLKPTNEILTGLGAGGALAGKFSGLKLTKPGALHLSAALSAESLRINQAIQTVTLEKFRAAMAEHAKRDPSFEANFGEPTPGKIQALDARLADLRVLENQIKQATAAVQSALPVGGESAVVGGDAEHLTKIAQSIVNGTLSAPLFETSADEAVSMVDIRRAVDNDRGIRRQNSPELASRVSEQDLYARRLGTYNFVAGYIESAKQRKIEAARKADEARRAAKKAEEDRRKRLRPREHTAPESASACLSVREERLYNDRYNNYVYRIRNTCHFRIVYNLPCDRNQGYNYDIGPSSVESRYGSIERCAPVNIRRFE